MLVLANFHGNYQQTPTFVPAGYLIAVSKFRGGGKSGHHRAV